MTNHVDHRTDELDRAEQDEETEPNEECCPRFKLPENFIKGLITKVPLIADAREQHER